MSWRSVWPLANALRWLPLRRSQAINRHYFPRGAGSSSLPDAVRRKRRWLGRKRKRLVRSKRLKVGVQTDVRRALAGEVRAADVAGMVEPEREGADSEEDGEGGRSRVSGTQAEASGDGERQWW